MQGIVEACLVFLLVVIGFCLRPWQWVNTSRVSSVATPIMRKQARPAILLLSTLGLGTAVLFAGDVFDWWELPTELLWVIVPLMFVIMFWSLFHYFSWWRRWRRRVRTAGYKLCPHCGYILQGLPSEHTCPECGEPYKLETVLHDWVRATGPREDLPGPAPPIMRKRAIRLIVSIGLMGCVLFILMEGDDLGWWALPRGMMGFIFPVFLITTLFIPMLHRSWLSHWRKKAMAVDFEMCPYCGYLLRGLPPEHTCPDCGEAYVLDQIKRAWDRATRTQ